MSDDRHELNRLRQRVDVLQRRLEQTESKFGYVSVCFVQLLENLRDGHDVQEALKTFAETTSRELSS